MENAEFELIQKTAVDNTDLKKLYSQHIKLEREVERLEVYARYSTSIAIKHARLKKQKLLGKEKIMKILAKIRMESKL